MSSTMGLCLCSQEFKLNVLNFYSNVKGNLLIKVGHGGALTRFKREFRREYSVIPLSVEISTNSPRQHEQVNRIFL